jgi:integrase
MWTIAKSWDGPTKSRIAREQALIPRSLAILHKWWEVNGCPESGVMFPGGHKGYRGGVGAKRAIILAQGEDIGADEVVRRAHAAGLPGVTRQSVYAVRSLSRTHKAPRAKIRYYRGYDWGWADNVEGAETRQGWWRRCGVSNRVRFHDMRDTAATHLLSGTWGPKWRIEEVSDFLGHSDVRITKTRYAHLTADSKRAAAALVDSRYEREHDRGGRGMARKWPGTRNAQTVASLENYWAPEEGLEPPANRLTADRSTN